MSLLLCHINKDSLLSSLENKLLHAVLVILVDKNIRDGLLLFCQVDRSLTHAVSLWYDWLKRGNILGWLCYFFFLLDKWSCTLWSLLFLLLETPVNFHVLSQTLSLALHARDSHLWAEELPVAKDVDRSLEKGIALWTF